jgi:hypothetical protein
MKKCPSETNYPCFLSVNSVQKFFKSSTKGVDQKKLYQMEKPTPSGKNKICIAVGVMG